RASDFGSLLPGVPDGSECYPLFEVCGSHWAKSDGQFLVRPARRHNPSIRNKDFAHAPGAFHLHRDAAARLPEWPLLLAPAAPMYDRRTHYKAGHEYTRAGSRHRKTMGHARRPGSTNPLLAIAPLGSDHPLAPLEDF